MKIYRLISITVVLFITLSLSAQTINLEKLSEKERNEKLLEIAKAAVLKYGPGYYRDYNIPGVPKPMIRVTTAKKGESTTISFPELENKTIYIVTFFYDNTKEILLSDFAVIVGIVGETGIPCEMAFGNNALRVVYDAEKNPQTRSARVIPIVPYEQKPERPQTYNRADYPD